MFCLKKDSFCSLYIWPQNLVFLDMRILDIWQIWFSFYQFLNSLLKINILNFIVLIRFLGNVRFLLLKYLINKCQNSISFCLAFF